jgi:hypothetical protein
VTVKGSNGVGRRVEIHIDVADHAGRRCSKGAVGGGQRSGQEESGDSEESGNASKWVHEV